MRADRIIGIHVLVPHEPARLIGANGQERQIDAAESFAHLAKMPSVPGVTRKIDLPAARADNESAP